MSEDKRVEAELTRRIEDLPPKTDRLFEKARQDILLFASRNRGCHLGPKARGLLFEVYCGISPNYQEDEDFYSAVVPIEELLALNLGFKTNNGCDWARSSGSYLGGKYKVERIPSAKGVVAVRLNGRNIEKEGKPSGIRDDIVKALRKVRCVVLDTSTNVELNHKNGRYGVCDYISAADQKVGDFQKMSKPVNAAKREHCKKCKETGHRYDATRLGYAYGWIYGDAGTRACEGCYWHDPHLFNSYISRDFNKEK